LIEAGSETVILSQGYYGRLLVPEITRKKLEEQHITFFILKTDEAIKLYNELQKTIPVGALIHSTC